MTNKTQLQHKNETDKIVRTFIIVRTILNALHQIYRYRIPV